MDPERAHALTLKALRAAGNITPVRSLLEMMFKSPARPVEVFGLKFKNPLGLAAGYDKDGVAIRGLSSLGFGHVEIGTVTPRPQPGNPAPRVFRLLEDDAVINRMGFPSRGSEFVQMQLNPALRVSFAERIVGFDPRPRGFSRLSDAMLGINLGRNKDTPNEEAVLDYLALLQNFAPYADYLTINVSSPNTAGLRELQGRAALESLLKNLHDQRQLEEKRHEKRLPILVKLSPDMNAAELDESIGSILDAKMDGIIVTNTTLNREGVRSALRGETGGLSGAPLTARSESVLSQTLKTVNGALPIVSAGGIMTPDDAKRRLDMGAALVQVYTGLIYHGPGLVRDILRHI